MTAEQSILSKLLDKYENSKHLSEPGISRRRVMLRIDKKELPEYDYENAEIRDLFNAAAQGLERQNLVLLEWMHGRPVLSGIVLNLEEIPCCYVLSNRIHPQKLAESIAERITSMLQSVSVPWVVQWRDTTVKEANESYKIPAFCKANIHLLEDLLIAFAVYDALHGEAITMRAFSSKCYHDTKHFEKEVREAFLRIARKHFSEFEEVCEQTEMGVRDQLAYLGIYARPELYEISGNCDIHTADGIICVAAAGPNGLAIPSTAIDSIRMIDLSRIQKLTFIENKTNYDEYILTERSQDELVVYHGGFLSPQKRKLFTKISNSIKAGTTVAFWADIDLGGFRMFENLQKIVAAVQPMRMAADDVIKHRKNGLARSEEYLQRLNTAIEDNEFPVFRETMKKIFELGITIEQESFLIDTFYQ